jgi:preprotein translocase subunit SecE
MVGLRRYVHIAFLVLFILAAFFLSRLFESVGGWLSFSYPLLGFELLSIVAWLIAGVGIFALWKRESVFAFAESVAQELKKVTWPTYDETRTATFVVIGMVVFFSFVLGLFDFVWSGVTNWLLQIISS